MRIVRPGAYGHAKPRCPGSSRCRCACADFLQRLAHHVGAAADEDHVLRAGQLAGPGHCGRDVGDGLAPQSVDRGLRGQLPGGHGAVGVRLREDIVRLVRQQRQDVRQVLVADESHDAEEPLQGVAFSCRAT